MELLLLFYALFGSGAVGMFTCCCTGCACEPGSSFQVDISGAANNTCAICSNFDGTYFLTAATTNCTGAASATCFWKYSNTTMTDVCSPARSCDGVCVHLTQVGGATPTCEVRVEGQGFTSPFGPCGFGLANASIGVFLKNFGAGASPSCSDYSALDIPFSSNINNACSFNSATCTVTAI